VRFLPASLFSVPGELFNRMICIKTLTILVNAAFSVFSLFVSESVLHVLVVSVQRIAVLLWCGVVCGGFSSGATYLI